MLLAQSQLIRKCDVVISTDTGFPVMQKDPLPFVFKSPVVVKPDPSGKNYYLQLFILTAILFRFEKAQTSREQRCRCVVHQLATS